MYFAYSDRTSSAPMPSLNLLECVNFPMQVPSDMSFSREICAHASAWASNALTAHAWLSKAWRTRKYQHMEVRVKAASHLSLAASCPHGHRTPGSSAAG